MTEDVRRYANLLYHRYATSIDAAEISVIQRSSASGAQRGKAWNHENIQQFLRDCSKSAGLKSPGTRMMEGLEGLFTPLALSFSPPVQGHTGFDLCWGWLIDKTQILYFSSRFLILKNNTSLATLFILLL